MTPIPVRCEDDLDIVGEAAVRVLVLTTFDLDDYIVEALAAGASGFLLKDADPDELVHAIRVVFRGDALLAPSVTRRVIRSFVSQARLSPIGANLAELTDREREVVTLVGARAVQP